VDKDIEVEEAAVVKDMDMAHIRVMVVIEDHGIVEDTMVDTMVEEGILITEEVDEDKIIR
jgi:hypothetical protein